MALVLGIDVSTTATKAVLVDDAGTVRGLGVAEYGFSVPHPLWSEQEPALWWDGALVAIRAALAAAGVTGAEVAAVGLTGQMHGAVLLDRRRRCAAARDPLERPTDAGRVRRDPGGMGPERLVEITGNDALTGFTAPKLAWVRDHEPDVWDASRTSSCPRTTSGSA